MTARPPLRISRLTKLRIQIGLMLLGGDFHGIVSLYQVIADRARACVTPEGQVLTAGLKPLTEALYTQLPGNWRLTCERTS
jgi:hypothetical protein